MSKVKKAPAKKSAPKAKAKAKTTKAKSSKTKKAASSKKAKATKAKASKKSTPATEELELLNETGRRKQSVKPVVERRQRRRQIDPTTCEREYSDPEIEFMQAMDDYKSQSGRMFPTCSEILEVLTRMGYRKVEDSAELMYDPNEKNEDENQEETLDSVEDESEADCDN